MNIPRDLRLRGLKYHKVCGLDYYLVSSLETGELFNINTNEIQERPETVTLDDIMLFVVESRIREMKTKLGESNV